MDIIPHRLVASRDPEVDRRDNIVPGPDSYGYRKQIDADLMRLAINYFDLTTYLEESRVAAAMTEDQYEAVNKKVAAAQEPLARKVNELEQKLEHNSDLEKIPDTGPFRFRGNHSRDGV